MLLVHFNRLFELLLKNISFCVCVCVCVCVCSTLYTRKVDKISSCITVNRAVCSAALGYMLKKCIICSVFVYHSCQCQGFFYWVW